ncbi:unnamed protein product [Dibothriocephalus latus]|uniref:MARVEL domain-containing protein n=1 Tax=Dibothriocephalus latus TaxID=60516 RepID=A0A3P7P2W1_DIBLA|nr:unnamed protein product [Dibothriocephalus latus]
MDLRRITATLLALTIVTLIVGLATPNWDCVSLFEDCIEEGANERVAMISVAALLVIGLVCLTVVFILDVLYLRSKQLSGVAQVARFCLLYLGAAMLLVAVIVYTAQTHNHWSYFLAVASAAFGLTVAILGVMASRCTSSSPQA